MRFDMQRDDITGGISFRGSIEAVDLVKLKLDRLDRALLDDVGSDGKATPADYLLALEMLFRRHAEQNAPPNTQIQRPGTGPLE